MIGIMTLIGGGIVGEISPDQVCISGDWRGVATVLDVENG